MPNVLHRPGPPAWWYQYLLYVWLARPKAGYTFCAAQTPATLMSPKKPATEYLQSVQYFVPDEEYYRGWNTLRQKE